MAERRATVTSLAGAVADAQPAVPPDGKPASVTLGCIALCVVGLLTSFPPLTMEIYIPSLPTIEESLHTSSAHVLSTISVYTISFGATQLVLGPLSDKHGRRMILLVAMSVYTVASAMCAAASSVELMYGPRFAQGAASAGALILGQAILRDVLPVDRREAVTTKLASVRSISPMAAPVLGSLLSATLGWRGPFGALVCLGAVAFVGSYWLLPESLPVERRQPHFSPRAILRTNAFLLSRRDFTCWALPEALGFGGFFVWISCSSYFLQGFYRIPVGWCGPLYAITFLGVLAGSSSVPRLRKRGLSPAGCYALGGGLSAAAGLLLGGLTLTPLFDAPSVGSQVVLQACMLAYVGGRAICMVMGQVQSLEPFPTRAASAAGLMGAVRMTSVSIVSVFAATLNRGTPVNACRIVALFGVAAQLSHLLLRPAGCGWQRAPPGRGAVKPSRLTSTGLLRRSCMRSDMSSSREALPEVSMNELNSAAAEAAAGSVSAGAPGAATVAPEVAAATEPAGPAASSATTLGGTSAV